MSNRNLDRRALLIAGAGIATTAALTTFEPAAAGTTTKKTYKGHFGPANTQDWHYLPFKVPKGVRQIEVSYSYPPTVPGPGYSKNVVDIGIFDPSGTGLGNTKGFRGWSGGARSSFKISKTSATPGYLPGPITPGRWRIALGPYQIISRVDYEVTITLHHGKPGKPFVPAPAPTEVEDTGQGWYRGDLHVHTVHSDGSQTQVDVLGYAKAAGLDFIGTSEHNTSSATETWGRYVPDDFLVIPGEEVTTRAGHWLATGIPAGTWIDWRYLPEDDKLGQFTQQVRDLGGLAIAAHPYIGVPSIRWDFGDEFTEMDAIEVWNGKWDGFDEAALKRWVELLKAGIFKPAVGNSDTHRQSDTIGLAQTVVRAAGLSVDALIQGYRLGHSWVAESSAVDLQFTATLDDVSGQCGDRVPADPGQQVAVSLRATGVAGCTARLYGPNGAITGGTATAVGDEITLDATVAGGTAFVRAEIRRGTSVISPMVALTNPIFLTAAG
ncbi:CehA/McbA family metallohydrolase [Nocardioides sp. SR21]|uniref:CehA/McbA family metallohydrolase n=1 Tax=Nocardioides sp. SR21 TaxID=2919501 RepID=UPI001FAAAF40|nr:CehA/McbA family metallohydrolase [Nocardioides sp. SR21]